MRPGSSASHGLGVIRALSKRQDETVEPPNRHKKGRATEVRRRAVGWLLQGVGSSIADGAGGALHLRITSTVTLRLVIEAVKDALKG